MMRSNSGGAPGLTREGASGCLFRIASNIVAEVRPANGNAPVTILCSTTPSEKISVRASTSSPRALLRRHVGDCPNRTAWTCQQLLQNLGSCFRLAARDGRRAQGTTRGHLRESKIENFGLLSVGHEDVRRLDIAMHNALRVRRG